LESLPGILIGEIALRRAAKPALQMGHEAEQPAAWMMVSGYQAP
jgi:hypothetical protein